MLCTRARWHTALMAYVLPILFTNILSSLSVVIIGGRLLNENFWAQSLTGIRISHAIRYYI